MNDIDLEEVFDGSIVTVVSSDQYQASGTLFEQIKDEDFISPDRPDSLLTDLIHRRHRGSISFHRLSSTQKNKNGRALFENLYSLKAKDVQAHFARIAPDLAHDSFFSINGMNRGDWRASRVRPEFSGALRNKSSVEYLTACFVDIDCSTLGITVGNAIGQVIDASDSGMIPKPSIFYRSGNGLWLYWLLRAGRDDQSQGEESNGAPRAHANRLNTWTRIQFRISAIFNTLGADKNSRDCARITRVLGTVNAKASVLAKRDVRSDLWLSCKSCGSSSEVVAYTLEELALKFAVRQDREMDDLSWSRTTVAKASDPRYRDRGIRGAIHLAKLRLERLTKLLALRDAVGKRVPIGKRRGVAMIYARFLFGAQERKNMDEIRRSLERLARSGMVQGHGVNAFDVVAEVFNTRGWERCRYSDLTIAERLDITDDESSVCGIPTVARASEEKLARDSKLSRTEKRSRRHLLIRDWATNAPSGSVATVENIYGHLVHAHGIEVSIRTVNNDIGFLVETDQVPASRFGRKAKNATKALFADHDAFQD